MIDRELVRTPPAPHPWRKLAISMAAGAVSGGLGSFVFLTVADGAVGTLDRSAQIAGLVAVIYLVTGLAMGLGLILPALGSRFLNVEDAEELREQRAQLTYAAIGMIAGGLALMLAAFAAPGGVVSASVALIGFVLALAIAVAVSRAGSRRQDELIRSVSTEASAIAFYLLALVGGGWSMLAHLAYVSGPRPIDWLTMIWALALVAAFVACGKRGLLKPR